MAKLVFLLEGKVMKEYALDKARMTIGRRTSNDIHIDNLAISGEHAVVLMTDDGVYIEDLNSTNGTVVNREKISKHKLVDGDVVRLGKRKLKFVQDSVAERPQQAFEPTEPISDEVTKPKAKRSLRATKLPKPKIIKKVMATVANVKAPIIPKKEHRPRLQILNGQDAGNTLVLDKAIMKIGRPNVQLALVTKRTQGYYLSHVLGKDYPLINGKPIDVHASALKDRDKIEVLGVKMQLCLD